MSKTSNAATDVTTDTSNVAGDEVLALQRQLTELTQQNAELKSANDDLSHTNEELVLVNQALTAEVNALKGDIAQMLEVPAVDVGAVGAPHPDDLPEEVHAAIAADPSMVAAAGLINGEQPFSVRRKLVDAAHRMGAFLEGGIFHNLK